MEGCDSAAYRFPVRRSTWKKFFPLVLLVVLPRLVKMHLVFTDMNHELGRKSDVTNDAGVLT